MCDKIREISERKINEYRRKMDKYKKVYGDEINKTKKIYEEKVKKMDSELIQAKNKHKEMETKFQKINKLIKESDMITSLHHFDNCNECPGIDICSNDTKKIIEGDHNKYKIGVKVSQLKGKCSDIKRDIIFKNPKGGRYGINKKSFKQIIDEKDKENGILKAENKKMSSSMNTLKAENKKMSSSMNTLKAQNKKVLTSFNTLKVQSKKGNKSCKSLKGKYNDLSKKYKNLQNKEPQKPKDPFVIKKYDLEKNICKIDKESTISMNSNQKFKFNFSNNNFSKNDCSNLIQTYNKNGITYGLFKN